ncbi:uncharacterized protein F4807DRAFT_132652 [Annulohypoxylon truncatum]|uniref:uncharacterized protein n=1 Tax=Annulohypoxylon truncatum TaxID=327061 RepID=UPI002007AA9E|nr:uncharacterized protein F4807DRAFT_132652 [Annulohypoxylon truncatum]KAI1208752.1 hypothetical protein F4807DRAFT_132652 [Annulohypoxylon truncatum]
MANSPDSSHSNLKESLVSHMQTRQENGQYLSESSSEFTAREPPVPILSKLLRGKGPEWEAIGAKPRPLQLLDLPVDILRLIVKEVTHTNDLTSLALTNSTLYYLTIPQIYARFDIVWPDDTVPPSDSKNVDALTYGLATLCLGSKFAQRSRWLRGSSIGYEIPSKRLADNQYARYTRKFSLGNGPKDWTSEYMVTKESGKMLGTLVAIAVGKMVNLETFVWDMPTGVLSEVFMALASLQDHYVKGEPKLEKVWIRWHDNSEIPDASSSISSPIHPPPPPLAVPPLGSTMTPVGNTLPSDFHPSVTQPIKYSESQVEYPTFSVLPPLKSLTVLDIDELAYLDEMSVLIERSRSCLRELRVGISQKSRTADFAQAWDSYALQQVDHDARWPGESRIGDRRLGGVMGVLVGRIYDIRRKSAKLPEKELTELPQGQGSTSPFNAAEEFGSSSNAAHAPHAMMEATGTSYQKTQWQYDGRNGSRMERKRLDGKLQLETLELERVPLSLQVCTKAIDWSVLTSLTIIDCMFVEHLWRTLKRQFHPTTPGHGAAAGAPSQYHLALKHIHTDSTSSTLISFIKETLAPNSLEVLFLQDRRRTPLPAVKLDQIFKGAIKRHKSSLKKLLLDCSNESSEGRRWSNWVLSSEIVSYITSGKMPNLKELSAAFDYKDWHPFLQRLPNIPQLRSLHIPYMLEHISSFEPKELALQLVDIITLRAEIQLCYVGIGSKCFEILETRPSDVSGGGSGSGDQGQGAIVIEEDDDNEDDGSEADEETEEDDDDDVNDDENSNGSQADAGDDLTDVSDDAESEADSVQEGDLGGSAARFRLREILFYDDKVAIFKARHARL